MKFRIDEVAAATNGSIVGEVEPAQRARFVDGASIDSRTIAQGALFVPIVAERDGHDFIPVALARGAAASLTSRPADQAIVASTTSAPLILVHDTAEALRQLGALARSRLSVPIIGITGSVGKTTTKDLTAAALSATLRTHASEKSFNNELGVPLTLLGAPDDVEACVVEMGARGIGHIAWLCETVRPTIAVVTAVEQVHTEFFGSLDEVAIGKGELVEALPANGTAILNAVNPRVAAMATHTSAAVVLYGTVDSDLWAESISLDEDLFARFTVRSPWGSAAVRVPARGAHNVGNALAALAVACVAGVPLEAAVDGLANATMSPWRMELVRGRNGTRVINDAYNAGPASVRAAVDALHDLAVTGRRLAVLGVMAEIGDDASDAHRQITEHAATMGISVLAVDAAWYGEGATHVADIGEAQAWLDQCSLGANDAVLVKGSRVAGLERLVDHLVGAPS